MVGIDGFFLLSRLFYLPPYSLGRPCSHSPHQQLPKSTTTSLRTNKKKNLIKKKITNTGLLGVFVTQGNTIILNDLCGMVMFIMFIILMNFDFYNDFYKPI